MCWDLITMGNVVFLIFYLGPLLSTTTRTLSRTTQHFLGFSLIIVPPHIFDSHIRSTVSWGVSGARMFPAARHKYPHPHIHPHPISPMPFGRDALADRWSIKKTTSILCYSDAITCCVWTQDTETRPKCVHACVCVGCTRVTFPRSVETVFMVFIVFFMVF